MAAAEEQTTELAAMVATMVATMVSVEMAAAVMVLPELGFPQIVESH